VGDSFTAADVYVGSGIGFGMQFGTIEKRPSIDGGSAEFSSLTGKSLLAGKIQGILRRFVPSKCVE
jgi:hypothetical protein